MIHHSQPTRTAPGRWRSTALALALGATAAGCILVPPGTSTGAVAARREAPPVALGAAERGPSPERWARGGGDRRWLGASRSADLVHIAADITLDVEARRLYGSATSTLRMLRDGRRTLRFEAEGIQVREVVDGDGRTLAHRQRGPVLEISLEEAVPAGDEVAVTVRYAADASRGFRVSLEEDGVFRPEVVASSADGALRTWLPTAAAPGELTTLDLGVTVADGMEVIANGVLVAVETAEGGTLTEPARLYRWSVRQPIPLDSVLAVAARFEDFGSETGTTGIYFHLPKDTAAAIAEQNFGESAAVLAHFEARLGSRFPFPRYDQAVLASLDVWSHDGASLTVTDASQLATRDDELDDRRERPRRAVARGLARKWFGAWLAPLGARHRWLLDGLACQLELDYEALVRGDGEVALEWEEIKERLVARARRARDPEAPGEDPRAARELDSLRAGWALRVIRARLGEEDFWRLVRRFVDVRGDLRVVTAEDFRRLSIEVLGADLGPELAQWAQRSTVPELEVRLQRREVAGVGASLGVLARQVQPGPLFHVPLEITLHFEDGTTETRTMVLDREETLLTVRLDRRLSDVAVDPRGVLLADLTVDKDQGSWIAQGLLSRPPVERLRALPRLQRLAAEGSGDAAQALVRILLESPEPTLRERCAAAVTFPGPMATGALMRAASEDVSPWVRRAALHALLQAYAAERWVPGDDELQRLLTLRQREVSPAALAEIEELLAAIPG